MKTLILGEAPSRRTDGGAALIGECGARLSSLLYDAPDYDRLRHAFDLQNCIDVWPGRNGKGSNAPLAIDVATAAIIASHDRVIALGWRVARLLNVKTPGYFQWVIAEGGLITRMRLTIERRLDAFIAVAVFPHPSRVNRWWNEPKQVEQARRFLRREARRVAAHERDG